MKPASFKPILPTAKGNCVHRLYVVEVSNRDHVLATLKQSGIDAGVHYPVPPHRQPALGAPACSQVDLPYTESAAARALSMPICAGITDDEVSQACDAFLLCAKRNTMGESVNRPTLKSVGIVDFCFGPNVTVVEPTNLYGCEIGDNSFVGPFVEIQRRVKIGKNTRVQSHSIVCELVTIGDNCFIGHGVMFINDTFATGGPARGEEHLWKQTSVGENVSVGS